MSLVVKDEMKDQPVKACYIYNDMRIWQVSHECLLFRVVRVGGVAKWMVLHDVELPRRHWLLTSAYQNFHLKKLRYTFVHVHGLPEFDAFAEVTLMCWQTEYTCVKEWTVFTFNVPSPYIVH